MNPTGTEARVCADIAARQAKGTAKYGTTVQDNPLGLTQWLQHAYEECLDQAVYLKRAIDLLQGAQPIPSNSAELDLGKGDAHILQVTPYTLGNHQKHDFIPVPEGEEEELDPHAELRKTWREGQRWQGIPTAWLPSGSWTDFDGQPGWLWTWTYRRHPEHKDAEPAPPADPHAALKAIYRPGMRWRMQYKDSTFSAWHVNDDGWNNPNFSSGYVYEIHPDDLPKEPTDDGWITVPDDLMEMPEGLGNMDRIEVRFRSGATCSDFPAGAFAWKAMPVKDPARVVAYRLIKPAE